MNISITYDLDKSDLKNALKQIRYMLENHPDIITSDKVNYKEINKYYYKDKQLSSVDDKYGIKTTLLVFLDKFNDSSIDILVYAFSKTTNWEEWLSIKEDIMFKIWKILEDNNLKFAFPSRTIYIQDNKGV